MTLGNSPRPPRWLIVAAGALAASLAACDDSTPATPDAAADNPPADMTPPPDMTVPPPDAGDVPQPPPDMTVPPPDMTVPPPDVTPDVTPPPDATPDADVPAMPTISTRAIVSCGTVCSRPLDAIPNAGGTVVYFTAYAADGSPGVFRATIPAAGMPPATPTAVVTGMGLEFPVGIALSHDDSTIYVADQTADRGMQAGAGAIFSLPATGGTPAILNVGTALIQPVSVTVTFDGNDLLIGGQEEVTDAMMEVTRRRAIFRVSRGGGTAMVVTDNVVDPSGLSQASTGVFLVHDVRRGGARSASAVTVGPAGVGNFAVGLVTNYPAGLGFSVDGRFALFSGADPNVGPGMLTFSGGDGMAMASAELSAGMQTPLGLHRARMVDSWAVADEGANETGQIFLVTRTP